MRKLLLSLAALICTALGARADEGMWLLKLMEQQHLADSLRKAGLQISPDELYSESAPSMRDVIGIFGHGCTGEVVSSDGLVFTNNHCGFSYVHDISTVGHNYLYEGYFAKSRAEELPCPGCSFTFVVCIDDVTDQVMRAAKKQKADVYTMQSGSFLKKLSAELLKKSAYKKTPGVDCRIVPYFGGNQFYAFYEQTFSDVRLVVNPPMQVSQFGFNQDNWMWPRHNADFAVFRIYADGEGNPAEYSEDNQPLHREKWLPISLNGVSDGDYTMIMGFPGRTSRYLTHSQVEMRCESINEPINLCGEAELTYMKQLMDSDPAMALKYSDQYMGLGNVVKNFGGMNESVRNTHLLDIKSDEEAAFNKYAATAGDASYTDIISRIDNLIAAYKDTVYDASLFDASLGAQEFSLDRDALHTFREALKSGKVTDQVRKDFLDAYSAQMGPVDMGYDLNKMILLAPYWVENHRLGEQPAFARDLNTEQLREYYRNLYAGSAFRSRKSLESFIGSCTIESFDADPFVREQRAIIAYKNFSDSACKRYSMATSPLNRTYVKGLCEMYNWAKSPDANFTLRMTYGHVGGYSPRDAVSYGWQTTLEGMMEKENPKDPDYVIDPKLREFFDAKNYGRYARPDGKLATCFLTNNDITGGNSGSGVLNAKGELIGLAFDGNIESLSSDLRFNPALQRCICVDIRYVLFVIDLYGGSSYVIDELELR